MMSLQSIGLDLEARGKRTYGAAEYGYEYEFDYIDMMRDNPQSHRPPTGDWLLCNLDLLIAEIRSNLFNIDCCDKLQQTALH